MKLVSPSVASIAVLLASSCTPPEPPGRGGNEARSAAYLYFPEENWRTSGPLGAPLRIEFGARDGTPQYVRPAGDINNDGVPDALISGLGAINVVFGQREWDDKSLLVKVAAPPEKPSLEIADVAYRLTGNVNGPAFVLGDLDDNGVPEIVARMGGDAVILFGEKGWERGDVRHNPTEIALRLHDASMGLGRMLEPVGDVNQDGVPDFLVGGKRDGGDAVFLVFPQKNWRPRDAPVDINEVSVRFENKRDLQITELGRSAAGVGDVNKDGHPDFVIGAMPAAYVVFGKEWTVPSKVANVGDESWRLTNSNDPYRFFGVSVTALGDVNSDGRGDFAVGAEGATYVVFSHSDFAERGGANAGRYSLRLAGDPRNARMPTWCQPMSGMSGYLGQTRGGSLFLDGCILEIDPNTQIPSGQLAARTKSICLVGDRNPLPRTVFGYGSSLVGDIEGNGLSDLIVLAPYRNRWAESEYCTPPR